MHQDNLRGGIHLRQRIRHGLLSRISAMNHASGPSQASLRHFVLQKNDVVAASGDEKIRDRGASCQPPQRENNQRHAVQLEELFQLIGAHACAKPRSRHNCGNSIHRSVILSQSTPRGRDKGFSTFSRSGPTRDRAHAADVLRHRSRFRGRGFPAVPGKRRYAAPLRCDRHSGQRSFFPPSFGGRT